jgi:ribosome-associated protein
MARIEVTRTIAIPEEELRWSFIRASGPGGQKVNKTASAVQLRFDAAASSALPEEVRQRLLRLAGRRATAEGVLVIEAQRFRTQERNREDALERLVRLIRRAAARPKKRKPTRPTEASRRERREAKERRSRTKRLRRSPDDTEG